MHKKAPLLKEDRSFQIVSMLFSMVSLLHWYFSKFHVFGVFVTRLGMVQRKRLP